MRAAEKYAEIEAAGLERPCCECHGETMQWVRWVRNDRGGYWTCAVKRRASQRAHYHSQPLGERHSWRTKNPEKKREIDREEKRRKAGWYDEGGMATKPMQAKELT